MIPASLAGSLVLFAVASGWCALSESAYTKPGLVQPLIPVQAGS